VTSAVVALRTARVQIGLRQDAVAVGGLVFLTALLVAATWGTWGDLDSDTGYDLIAGARVADGELPYRDFVYYYGPLAPFLSGLAALVAGPGLWPAVGLGLAIALGIVAATYALARIVVPPLGAFLAGSITAAVAFVPSNYSFVLPHTHGATLGTLLLLLLLLALWRYSVTEQSRWAVAAGTALGLVALTKPEPAAAALLAVGAWLLLRARTGVGARHPAALMAAPAAAIPAVVYGFFLTVVSPGSLLFENLWPVDELDAGGTTLIRARMPLSGESAVELLRHSLPYAVGLAGLVLLARLLERPGRWRSPLVFSCAAAGAVFAAACVAKPDGLRDGLYYAYGWIPLGALAGVVVLAVRSRRMTPGAGLQVQLAAAVALSLLAFTTYNGFVVHGWRPTMSVYYIPLAAILIVRLHLVEAARGRAALALGVAWVTFLAAAGTGLTLKDARAESFTVRGPGGALAETPAEGALYQNALAEIALRTEPGEPILVAPLMTGLYPLSGHESPLDKISMLPGALPEAEDQLAAIEQLEAAGVRLVVTDDRTWIGYGHGAFGETFDTVLAGWVGDNFDRVATLRVDGETPRTLDVWIRRTQR
jgi:hypothetical protein